MISEILREKVAEPTPETGDEKLLSEILIHYPTVTADAAVAAFKHAFLRHSAYPGQAPTEVTDEWKHEIDGAASDAMIARLSELPFHTEKIASEGAKEIFYAGVHAPNVLGAFKAGNGLPTLWGISDVVEQTTRLSRLQEGAVSVMAISKPEGMMPTPEGSHYMMKLIGPPQANGVMSLDMPHEQNLDTLIQTLGIRPHELTQITLNDKKRPMNTPFIEAARRVGVNLKIVDSGDLMPGLLAASDAEENGKGYFVLATRGGIEEGSIAALGAKIQGGFMEARVWESDPQIYGQNPLLTLDTLAPERSQIAMISVTGITGDEYLDIPPVDRLPYGDYRSTTLTISPRGIRMVQHLHEG